MIATAATSVTNPTSFLKAVFIASAPFRFQQSMQESILQENPVHFTMYFVVCQ